MRWQDRRRSTNVEDRRGISPKGLAGGGIGMVVIVVIVLLLGGDLGSLIDTGLNESQNPHSQYQSPAEENEMADFVSVVLAETEDVWTEVLRLQGITYRKPKLVIYSGTVQSACGLSGTATRPFYCPADEKLYIDLSFFRDLQTRFRAPGDFAMAYVIAHEVGHHIQNILGIMDQMNELRGKLDEREFNRYSVRLELQADFFAGVWAHYVQRTDNLLEEGDIEEALNAASAVGDDRIQKSTQGYVVPDAFTHGTSEQRKRWFYRGFVSGDIRQGDTFTAREL